MSKRSDCKNGWMIHPRGGNLIKGDLAERKLWSEYQQAYEDALTRCNSAVAPWHIIPSDRKWVRNLLISRLLRETLEHLNPEFPPPAADLDGIVIE